MLPDRQSRVRSAGHELDTSLDYGGKHSTTPLWLCCSWVSNQNRRRRFTLTGALPKLLIISPMNRVERDYAAKMESHRRRSSSLRLTFATAPFPPVR